MCDKHLLKILGKKYKKIKSWYRVQHHKANTKCNNGTESPHIDEPQGSFLLATATPYCSGGLGWFSLHCAKHFEMPLVLI